MSSSSMALHRRAEVWMGRADSFRARGKDAVARWSLKRGAVWERRAVDAVRQEHPERLRTIAILEESALAMEKKAAGGRQSHQDARKGV